MKIDKEKNSLLRKEKKLYDKTQERLLDYYYDVEEENKTVKATICYSKAEDIIDPHYQKSLKLNEEIMEEMKTVIKGVSEKYSLVFSIKISDMQGYSTKDFTEAFQKKVNLSYYSLLLSYKRKKKLAFALTTIGVLFLFLNIVLQILKPFNDTSSSILFEIIDIIATVFIWEAASIYFVEGYETRWNLKALSKRILKVEFQSEKKSSELETKDLIPQEKIIKEIKESLE